MHTEIVRGLGIRDAPLFDQPHSLKLELPGKLPSLHDPPPVPSKHLTRCLRNRVQAKAAANAVKERNSAKVVDAVGNAFSFVFNWAGAKALLEKFAERGLAEVFLSELALRMVPFVGW